MKQDRRPTPVPTYRPGDREPPHAPEAERALLGAALIDTTARDRIVESVPLDDWYNPDHQRIAGALAELAARGLPGDAVTVASHLGRDWARDGGMSLLSSLVRDAASGASLDHYTALVAEKAALRRMIVAASAALSLAYDPSAQMTSGEIGERLVAAGEQHATRGTASVVTLAEAVSLSAEGMRERRERGVATLGLLTGWTNLDRHVNGLLPGELTLLAARPGMGKAQPDDARVLMADGSWKLMRNVRVGGRVASVDGAESVVLGVFPQGWKQSYRVTFKDGRSTECSADHLWSVHYRLWPAPRVLATSEVQSLLCKRRYQRRLWIDVPSGDFGSDDPLPIDPWVLGVLLGNGGLTNSSGLMFSTADRDTLDKLAERLGDDYELRPRGGYDWRISSRGQRNKLRDALRDLGLLGHRSEDKFIPAAYLRARRQARLDLLRGLMDTDGWAQNGSLCYSTSSPALAADFESLVRSLGGHCRFSVRATSYTYKGEHKTGLPSFRCTVCHHDPNSLVTLERRKVRGAMRGLHRETFVGIEPTIPATMRCIAVSHPSQTYITDDYVVTHNTTALVNLMLQPSLADVGALWVSPEAAKRPLGDKAGAVMSGQPARQVRFGIPSEWMIAQQAQAAVDVSDRRVWIYDDPRPTVGQIASVLRRLMAREPVRLVAVDHLFRLDCPDAENESRELRAGLVALQELAQRTGVHMLVVTQLSRKCEERGKDKRPILSDLQGSGASEQNADHVWFLYRDDYYLRDDKCPPDKRGVMEWIVAKARYGEPGTVMFAADMSTGRIAEQCQDEPPPSWQERYPDA